MSIAFVFPGQGSQAVGMGREFVENFTAARHVMEEVDESLKFKLSKLILNGSIDELTLTENAQPAPLAVSMAILKSIEHELGKSFAEVADYAAGHSLGEYSALCAAEVFNLKEAVNLVRLRGKAMQQAVPAGAGTMAAILGLDLEIIENLVQDLKHYHNFCVVANDNAPGQVVISGHTCAVKEAIERSTEAGAKKAISLSVSAPFHSPLMQPAAHIMKDALQKVSINKPTIPVLANITAQPIEDKNHIIDHLVEQITGRVRWRESIQNLSNFGCNHAVEIGAGKVLTGSNKRINGELNCFSINIPEDIDKLLLHID